MSFIHEYLCSLIVPLVTHSQVPAGDPQAPIEVYRLPVAGVHGAEVGPGDQSLACEYLLAAFQ